MDANPLKNADQIQCGRYRYRDSIGIVFFVLLHLAFCITNIDYEDTEFRVSSISYKHIVFCVIAFISTITCFSQVAKSVLMLLPIASIYLFSGLYLYALMVLIFALGIPLISFGLRSIIENKQNSVVYLIMAISCIPFFTSINLYLEHGLFNLKYGRPRMLLGFFHPKEAGVAFAVPFILKIMMDKKPSFVFSLMASAFIFIIGSRNAALMPIFAYFFSKRFSQSFLFLIGLIVSLCFCIQISPFAYTIIDNISSLRLSLWSELITNATSFTPNSTRFGCDNFFIECYVLGREYATLVFFSLGILFVVICICEKHINRAKIAFVLLMTISFFDTGISSIGNILHILLWGIIFSSFQRRPDIKISKT